jgi:perosamine synthetase
LGLTTRANESYIEKKLHMADLYTSKLKGCPHLELPTQASWAKNVYWMYAVLVSKQSPISRDELRKKLKQEGIDTRDYFVPLHRQPVFANLKLQPCPVSDDLSERGFYLPSGLAITGEQITAVTKTLITLLS